MNLQQKMNLQRKKLDDKFEFPLEIDMRPYLNHEALLKNSEPEQFTYELKSIVIHRGGAYGGHYWAYVKDDLGEGNWNLETGVEKMSEPTETLRKKFDV